MSGQSISAEEFDRRFDEGEDISDYIDFDSVRFPGREQKSVNPETISISSGYIIGSRVGGSSNTDEIHNITTNSKKHSVLAEAADKVQKLLQQLDKSDPSETVPQQALIVSKIMEEIDANPALKEKIIAAVKDMGIEAFIEIINHPVAMLLQADIESWQNKN